MNESLLNNDGTLDVERLERHVAIPVGEYIGKLADIKVTEPQKNNDGSERLPQLEATYEIIEGPQKGRTQKNWYGLNVEAADNGKVKSRGIADLVLAFHAVGFEPKKLPVTKPMEMRKLVAQTLGKKKLKMSITDRAGSGQYAGKTYRNVRITGEVSGAPVSHDDENMPSTPADDIE